MKRIIGTIALFTASIAFAWNVTELGNFDSPNLAHYLDVLYTGDEYVYACGSGGFDVIDVTDMIHPTRTGHLAGSTVRPQWNCAVHGSLALVCLAGNGLNVIDVSNPAIPSRRATLGEGIYDFEDVQFINHRDALVCLGEGGIGLLRLEEPYSLDWQWIDEEGLSNAKALALSADSTIAYIADESGLVIYVLDGEDQWSYRSDVPLSGSISDVQLDGSRVYLALGTAGVAIVDVTQPASPQHLATFDADGLSAKLAVENDRLVVANWEDFQVYDVSDPNHVELIGFRFTPERAMCVAMVGDTIICGDWEIIRIYTYGEITGPDLEVSPRALNFPETELGGSSQLELTFTNYGQSAVVFDDFVTQPSEYSVDFSGNDLPPGETSTATVIYQPVEQHFSTGRIRILTNDGDESSLTVRVSGNPPLGGVSVGNEAPDFTLTEHRGEDWTLSDHRGRIVVMAFFATW